MKLSSIISTRSSYSHHHLQITPVLSNIEPKLFQLLHLSGELTQLIFLPPLTPIPILPPLALRYNIAASQPPTPPSPQLCTSLRQLWDNLGTTFRQLRENCKTTLGPHCNFLVTIGVVTFFAVWVAYDHFNKSFLPVKEKKSSLNLNAR